MDSEFFDVYLRFAGFTSTYSSSLAIGFSVGVLAGFSGSAARGS